MRVTDSSRRTLRRAAPLVLCVTTFLTGAGLAYATHPTAASSGAAFPRPMPPPAAIPALTRRLDDATPALDPEPAEPAEPAHDDAPSPTFAENLRDGMVITGASAHRILLFTFDDGPDARNTPRLLDTLDQLGVRAVFFLPTHRMEGRGAWAEQNREIAREIARRGHVVANHTHRHVQLPTLESDAVLEEASRADDVIADVLGARTWLLRPPGGSRSPRVDRLLASRGYTQMLWNLGTGDPQVRDADAVVRTFTRVLAHRERSYGERGGIVLLHDTHAWSVDAVPRIVSWVRERNCALLAAGEELYDIVDDPRWFHTPRGERDASDPAPVARFDEVTLARRQGRLAEETRQRCERVASR